MKKLIMVVVACITFLAPAVARAHEGHLHNILGTVSSIDHPHVVVKTTDGKSVTVMLDKETKITRGKEKLDAASLKVGERVSVDYMEEKGMNMARAVKLATTPPPTKK
jgi:phosphopantetheine adenylyltransferase